MIARSQRTKAAPVDAAPAAKQEYLYQLKSWVSMGAPFNTGACIRALALLSREPVSLAQLCTHSGLESATARHLLVELGQRGVLRGIALSSQRPIASSVRREPVHSNGLLGRLSRWIRGGGKAA